MKNILIALGFAFVGLVGLTASASAAVKVTCPNGQVVTAPDGAAVSCNAPAARRAAAPAASKKVVQVNAVAPAALPPRGLCQPLKSGVADYQSALLKKYNLVLRCDNQSFAGGFNLKPEGGAFPVRVNGASNDCLFRLHGEGGVYKGGCMKKLQGFSEQNGQLVIRTSSGNYIYAGGITARKM